MVERKQGNNNKNLHLEMERMGNTHKLLVPNYCQGHWLGIVKTPFLNREVSSMVRPPDSLLFSFLRIISSSISPGLGHWKVLPYSSSSSSTSEMDLGENAQCSFSPPSCRCGLRNPGINVEVEVQGLVFFFPIQFLKNLS